MTEAKQQHSSRVREWMGSRRMIWLVLIVAVGLSLPTLDVGLVGDDLPQAEFLRSQRDGSNTAPWWDMFVLVSGPRAHNEMLREAGMLPWWVDPELRVAFFRPLSVATHVLDYQLWPDAIWAMHLHSLVWYAALCALAWVAARRLGRNASAAGIAGLIYAAAFSHHIPVAWLAHRNGLVSAVFSLAAIIAHDQWRRDGRKLAALLAPVSLVAALLAGEAGVVTLAFVIAYALVLDTGSRKSRLASTLPAIVAVVMWRLLYDHLGYGVTGSGAYLDPVNAPAHFLAALPERYFALVVFSVSLPVASEIQVHLWWLVALFLLGSAGVFITRAASPTARFGALAAALGCIPLTASVPFERLFVLTSFGVALVWGELIDTWMLQRPARFISRVSAGVVVAAHLVVSPAAFMLRNLELDALRQSKELFGESAWPGNPTMQDRAVVVVHSFHYLAIEYLPRILSTVGESAPASLWVLHAGAEPPEVHRIDERTLELRADPGWPAGPVTEFWRDPEQAPFVTGERVMTREFSATIEEVSEGRATRVRFRFNEPLDDPKFAWLLWHDRLHRKVTPAAIW